MDEAPAPHWLALASPGLVPDTRVSWQAPGERGKMCASELAGSAPSLGWGAAQPHLGLQALDVSGKLCLPETFAKVGQGMQRDKRVCGLLLV